jgi:hypothetical protein
MAIQTDSLTGLEYDDSTVQFEPLWLVVDSKGTLAYSVHKSKAAALAWIRWHMPKKGLSVVVI